MTECCARGGQHARMKRVARSTRPGTCLNPSVCFNIRPVALHPVTALLLFLILIKSMSGRMKHMKNEVSGESVSEWYVTNSLEFGHALANYIWTCTCQLYFIRSTSVCVCWCRRKNVIGRIGIRKGNKQCQRQIHFFS